MKTSPCLFGSNESIQWYQAAIETTNNCNMKCGHCCNNADYEKSHRWITREDFFAIIDELKATWCTNVYLTWGETTILPYFKEIIRYVKDSWMWVMLATNAFDIENHIQFLSSWIIKNWEIFISLDWIGDIHDKFRKVEWAFARTGKAIKWLTDNGMSVRISSIVWNWNKDSLEEMISYVKNLWACHIHFSLLWKVWRGESDNSLTIDEDDYKKVIEEIARLSAKYNDEKFLVSVRRNEPQNEQSDYCHAGEKMIYINYRWIVSPCSWIDKTPNGPEYSLQWEKWNMSECLEKVWSIQELVKERIKLFWYSWCPAIALEYSWDIMSDDPLNRLLKHE